MTCGPSRNRDHTPIRFHRIAGERSLEIPRMLRRCRAPRAGPPRRSEKRKLCAVLALGYSSSLLLLWRDLLGSAFRFGLGLSLTLSHRVPEARACSRFAILFDATAEPIPGALEAVAQCDPHVLPARPRPSGRPRCLSQLEAASHRSRDHPRHPYGSSPRSRGEDVLPCQCRRARESRCPRRLRLPFR